MELRAIETRYKGFRFRSRLEARWAVFLDGCDAEWNYEHEGFELPSGRYLPDFWLPEEKLFLEIKPGPMPQRHSGQPLSRETILARELFFLGGQPVYVFYGEPAWALAPPEFPGMTGWVPKGYCPSFLYLKDYEHAALQARRARFEHGECGAPA